MIIILFFNTGLNNLANDHKSEGKQILEDALRKNAVACYANEGFYPPNVEYLEEYYGVQIDHNRYSVSYMPIAENLMPDITVLEK